MRLSRPITVRPFWAVILPLAATTVHAQATTAMTATGTYSSNGSAPTTVASSYPGHDPVNIGGLTTGSGGPLGLHVYGSTEGNFGSRSTGYGLYDASGTFQIVQTITNVGAVPQSSLFNFYITPGFLQNDLRSVLTGSQFVTSGISFDIQRNGTSVWGSAATLTTNASGTSFTQTGANLYTGAANNPTYYAIDGANQSVDLGVLNAGESIELTYTLSTFARGDALGGANLFIPEQSYLVPAQWTDYYVAGYGGADHCLFAAPGPPISPWPGYGGPCGRVRAAHTATVAGHQTTGGTSGSYASSGDPFDFERTGDGHVTFSPGLPAYNLVGPPTVTFGAVPEPETYALTLSGLGVLAMAARRRRRSFRFVA